MVPCLMLKNTVSHAFVHHTVTPSSIMSHFKALYDTSTTTRMVSHTEISLCYALSNSPKELDIVLQCFMGKCGTN